MRSSLILALLLSGACRVSTLGTEEVGDADGDGVLAGDDCNDADASAFPGAPELCDGIDNNCDGTIDELDPSNNFLAYADADDDGWGDADNSTPACTPPAGYVDTAGDCDDLDPRFHPEAAEDDCNDPADYNCDGSSPFADVDGDGFAACDDCNDADADVFPGAVERCNGVDDDCNELVDDEPVDPSTYYSDADRDGHGDPDSSTTACQQPPDTALNADDCDDNNALINPNGTERCNDLDDDCNGLVDDDPLGANVWYADGDGDGFGTGPGTAACTPPDGHTLDTGDCDDTNAAVFPTATEQCNGIDDDCNDGIDEGFDNDRDGVSTCDGDCDDNDNTRHPGAPEFCNGIDDDCDQRIDDADDDRQGGTLWYTDNDGDQFGDPATASLQCEAVGNQIATADDCDDSRSNVNPARDERCDGLDNDCDNEVDEEPIDGIRYPVDADGDGYGDPVLRSEPVCAQPDGHADNSDDCDDDRSSAYPGAVELLNQADDDCDGLVDEGQPYGSGADGPLTVSATLDLSVWTSPGRTAPDAVAYGLLALDGAVLTLDDLATGIAPGDEVVVANLHGTDAAHSQVGAWTFGTVVAVNGELLTLEAPVERLFGEAVNSDLSGQDILVQRVPHYTRVDVAATGALITAPWDGHTGGLLALRASEAITIASGGRIDVSALGYAGGDTGLSGANCDAFQGESYAGQGEGQGNGACNAYNEATGQWRPNYGGGGAHICGGGGEYAGGATASVSWNGGSASPARAGLSYGDADLDRLFYGSGGGGVWSSHPDQPRNIGPGGAGGGAVYLSSPSLTVAGARGVRSEGGTTVHWGTGTWTYGAGGGAGGSIYLVAADLSLATNALSAMGGLGYSNVIRPGGNGGVGRIRLDFERLDGDAAPSDLSAVSIPDPGFTATP